MVGLPDDRKGEVPVAAVRLLPGATAPPDDIITFAASRLSDYKRPASVVIVDDFPRTGTDKVQKQKLLPLFTDLERRDGGDRAEMGTYLLTWMPTLRLPGGSMAEYKFVTYETLDDGAIARIMLNRPEARNAQNRGLLVELDDAFLRAEADDAGAGRDPRRRRARCSRPATTWARR